MNFDLSISQAVDVWSSLCDSYYGQSDWGDNSTEIYAYMVSPNSHFLNVLRGSPEEEHTSSYLEEKRRVSMIAAQNLVDLLCAFSEKYPDCDIFLEGEPLGTWFAGQEFNHRAHVEIKRK